MKATIRNKGGQSSLTIKCDFYQIIDENFTEICKAITNKVKILKELYNLLNTDDQAVEALVQILMKSITPEDAAQKLQEEFSISNMAVHYLLNKSLYAVTSMNAESIEQELAEYRKQMEAICSQINEG